MLSIKSTIPHQVLSVFLNQQMFGIPIQAIQDVLTEQFVTPLPMADDYIRGIMNLRGRIVTVVDLAQRLSVHRIVSEQKKTGMNVVIEEGHDLFSLYVDRIGDVINIDQSLFEENPATLNPIWRDLSIGVYRLDSEIMVILDAKKILFPSHDKLLAEIK